MVYLLHFENPISDSHTCQHYIGSTGNIEQRLKEHRQGKGARLTQVASERGINFILAWVWEGDKKKERKLKNRKNAPKLCPFCRKRLQ
jgi:predicted GIY-YIG superfamily endonuclease